MANMYAYRIDNHGDDIRPQAVQEARTASRAGTMSDDELRAIEDEAILEHLSYQRRLTLSALSDGGFRNGDYRSPVLWSVQGFTRMPDRMRTGGFGVWIVDAPLKLKKPIASDAASFLLDATKFPVKVKLPSAAHLAAQCYDELATVRAYPGAAALGDAIAELLHDEIEHLLEIGVKYIQLDNPDYAAYLAGREGEVLSFEDAVAIDQSVVAGLDKEEDQRIGLTIGWGEHTDAVVDVSRAEALFSTDYDKYLFPYHTDEAVKQGIPRLVPDEKQIGIGILDATNPELEDIDAVMKRIDQALEVHEFDRIGLSPQHGFQRAHYLPTSLTIEDQRKKLEHVETLATMVWGNEA